MKRALSTYACGILLAGIPSVAFGQPVETLGARASGMGGAFVAVADDASAVYWNPAGLASGAFFSLVVDRSTAKIELDNPAVGSSRSGGMIALSAPPLGLSYYRLRHTTTAPVLTAPAGSPNVQDVIQVSSLVTHHAGVTVLQSLTDVIAVGATLKILRGVAASGVSIGSDREALLDADDLVGRASNTVDADLGLMASLGVLKAGLLVRNLREPEFESSGSGGPVELDRQVRAGVAFLLLQDWLTAIDVDLTRQRNPVGDTRNVAAGLEGRVLRRATVRGGVRVNTVEASGRRPVITAGGSFAVFGSTFVDAHVTGGSGDGDRGWGISGRVLF
jgi:hypothetical protein